MNRLKELLNTIEVKRYEDYLTNDTIEGVIFDISENEIRIYDNTTLFYNLTKEKMIEKDELIKKINLISKIAKDCEHSEIKIKGSKVLKDRIENEYYNYIEYVIEKNYIFKKMAEHLKETQKEGLKYGTTDDLFGKIIYIEYYSPYQRMIDKTIINGLEQRLDNIISDLQMVKDNNNCTKQIIYL